RGHRRGLHLVGPHQGRPRQDGRGPHAHVDRFARVPRLLRPELDPDPPAQVGSWANPATRVGRRPSGAGRSIRAPARPAVRPPGSGRPTPACTIEPMFERTTLPDGPRVISARLAGARSASVAAYVLAGSRLEAPGQVGVAHFLEHLTF